MKFKRASGIILHPTSLPSKYGIGDIGPAAVRWIEWLSGSGCKLWQVLPLGPTGFGDSPYQCFSAFAGNPYLISPDVLLDEGLLTKDDLADVPESAVDRIDYGSMIPWKLALLERAFERFTSGPSPVRKRGFNDFRTENASWLDDYALFMALKEAHGGGAWDCWPLALRKRESATIEQARQTYSQAILRYSFYQYLFFEQWVSLKATAKAHGIKIIGDIPIFVAYDSADVWAHPDLFYLDEEGNPTVVAGVPPDYFSPTGQLWGNPLYQWNEHWKTGYTWWCDRLAAALKTVDIIRLDHFRGFAGYWEIPAGAETAENGCWVPGPGAEFFNAARASLGDLPIIAEDLGEITPDVIALREHFSLPGMKILQFAFSDPENAFLPHKCSSNSVVYTGTHDNDTTLGWYASAPENEKDFARRYLQTDGQDFAWDLIRAAWSSTAVFALTPMQDLLRLGTEARMNYPSRLGGNWEWRMEEDAPDNELMAAIRELNYLYER
ncbi:MAG: 4-alpha-glucanotransferase [Chloroflexota bacterium]